MKRSLLGPAVLALALAAGPAGGQTALFECVGKTGKVRFTNAPCRDDERVAGRLDASPPSPEIPPSAPDPEPPAEENDGQTPEGLLPGTRSDLAGGALRYHGKTWTIVNTLHSYAWSRDQGWTLAGPVGEDKKKALRNVVEAFNRIPDLGLKLEYAETDDPAVVLPRWREHRDKFVVYWAEDAEEGGLNRPFSWHPGRGYKGGTTVFVQNEAGKFVSERAATVPAGPLKIAGAAIFARERIKNPSDLKRCKTDAPYYAFLHEVGHALGLGHATPGPSIMKGTCGMEYLPPDIRNIRRLYGR